jgi:hypothetical protein
MLVLRDYSSRIRIVAVLRNKPIPSFSMAEMSRRNIHVFSSSNGTEMAGMINECVYRLPIHPSQTLGFFQHGGVSISTFIDWISKVCYVPSQWALYPCKPNNNRAASGPALDSSSGDEIQPGRYVIRTVTPGEFMRSSIACSHSRSVSEASQTIVYLTSDVPRTRMYSINCTHTSHVRLWNVDFLQLKLLKNRIRTSRRESGNATNAAASPVN